MSKRRFNNKTQEVEEVEESEDILLPTSHTVQNLPPNKGWHSFEQCWHSCVKNGTPLLMESCKAHLRAMGWLNRQEKWIDGMRHFGISIEK
jgi:hypothetical protein